MTDESGDASHKSYCDAVFKGKPPCKRPAGWGTDHPGVGTCKHHLGSTSNHRKAAHLHIVQTEARRQLQAEGYEPIGDPVHELLALSAEITGLKDVLRERVSSLADPEWVTRSKLGVEDVRAIVAAYERALDRCERTLTNLLKLDLEVRRQRLAEQEGEIIAAVVNGVIADLGLAERSEVRALVRRHFEQIAV
jgi:hypothetical protein